MAVGARQPSAVFDPDAFGTFRFLDRELGGDAVVRLRYGLDEEIVFTEEIRLPVALEPDETGRERIDGLLSLLHWVAGVSYYKAAAPPRVTFDVGAPPPPATAVLLEALYSEGLGEFAYVNRLALPRPRFAGAERVEQTHAAGAGSRPASAPATEPMPERVLVPVGGGKDSAVALEIVRSSGVELSLFSVGDAPPISRTAAVAELPRLIARRRIDPRLLELNGAGALNGHVPVTAIVACVALLTAALCGFDTVVLANERSASSANVTWDGVAVNHQFSKGRRAELLMRAALAEVPRAPRLFSVLRPASELAVARTFARMSEYHAAFTSCNAIFRIDPGLRAASWCCDCPKCRFVFLALAPFSDPAHLREIFGADLLADERQLDGFALLTATGGHKPFECVGEEQESIAAVQMLGGDPRWREHPVVARLSAMLAQRPAAELRSAGAVRAGAELLRLEGEHSIPDGIMEHVRALLGA